MKVGIFGGTFNPIHYGHLRAAEEVREKLRLDRILFIPSGTPSLKTEELAEAVHRYKMTRLAVVTNRFFELSDIECRDPGKSYTVKTVEELKKASPGIDFLFILGIDAFLDIPNWWNPENLIVLMDFVVIPRSPFRFVDLLSSPYISADERALKKLDAAEIESYTAKLKGNRDIIALRLPIIDISATRIRKRLSEGKSIKYLLPEAVESYIISNKLYKCNK
ncbi:MAG: nicotinate-nucleotide adenylyltransferase [Nitrospirae bacterium]|nr:nicotinate-nucleotide adenylyltransferase [Nitrospirota bacterium]